MNIKACKRQALRFGVLLIAAIIIITLIVGGQGVNIKNKFLNKTFLGQMLCDGMPVFYSYNLLNGENVRNIVLGFDISSPFSIIQSNVFAFSAMEVDKDESEEETPEPVDMSGAKPIKETTISGGSGGGYYEADGVMVKNATSYTFDAQELINEPLTFDFNDNSGPLVMIVHSHSSESYTATDKNYYLPTDPDRTEDINYNVVRVGTEIAETIEKNGIKTVHDTSLHDYPSYNGSYKSSLASVNSYLEKYPSIKIVLDIHRDAMVQADGTKLKLVSDADGKKAAQIMLLTGSDQGGLDHPNWRENLKFAMKLQRVINNMYPGLARPVSFTKERYNTHTTTGSIIIEVGTTGNTLEEALVSAEMIGKAVVQFITELR